jgi:DNA helicase-2/ATP-dependent DNA helicase PcrA
MSINLNNATAATFTKFNPSPAQQDYFDWVVDGRGNAILEAVAGAGKTTTILNGVVRMEGRIWLGVYNKKMADELKGKVARNADLRDRRGLYISTFHSAGYSALRFAFSKMNALQVDDKKVKKIVKRMAGTSEELFAMAGAIPAIISMAKNRGIGPVVPDTDKNWTDMLYTYDLTNALPAEYDMNLLLDACREVLAISNADLSTVDFDDMVYLPLQRKLRMLQHEWVIVDEAQDTNPTRRAMAAALLAPGGRFIAVGDPRQAIFGFTGADNDSLEQLRDAFDAITLPLTVTFRCPKAVVEVARTVVSHITAHESAPEGIHRVINEEQFPTEVSRWDRHDYSDIAILCRVNAPLVAMCFGLIRQDIPAKIEGRNIGEGLINLCQKWKVSTISQLQERLEAYYVRENKKALKRDDSNRLSMLEDEKETMKVLIANTQAKGGRNVHNLVTVIRNLFDDDVSGKGTVTLCSAHRSKGMEWKTVYIYGRNKYMPHHRASKTWEIEQEKNLIYVAVTRAMNELIDINVEM